MTILHITKKGTIVTIDDVKEFLKQKMPTVNDHEFGECEILWCGLAHDYLGYCLSLIKELLKANKQAHITFETELNKMQELINNHRCDSDGAYNE